MASSYNGAPTMESSRASSVLSVYETYLFSEPFGRSPHSTEQGSTNLERQLEMFRKSTDHFTRHSRTRTVERLRLDMARLYIRNGEEKAAIQILLPLWQNLSWRREGWYDLMAELDWMLRDCARLLNDEATVIAVEWELLCNRECQNPLVASYSRVSMANLTLLGLPSRAGHRYDFSSCLDEVESSTTRPKVSLSSDEVLSCSEYWPHGWSAQE